MQEVNNHNPVFKNGKSDKNILPVIVLWLSVIVIGIILWGTVGEGFTQFRRFYIIPWLFITALVIAAPSLYLIYKKQFTLYHPLVFAAASYFIPSFIIGGFFLAAGTSEPYFLAYVTDPEYNFPLTYIVVMLGYGGLTIGFFLPFGKKIGDKIKGVLPTPNWKNENIYFPGLMLLGLGMVTTSFAYVVGVLGFQTAQEIGTYDGLIFLTTLFWIEASFLLWLVLFRRSKFDVFSFIIGSIVFGVSLVKALYAGNRGSLLQVAIMITLAYILAGKKVNFKQGIVIGILTFLSITVGMIYGTTFRNVKQTQSKIDIEQYTEKIFETFDVISQRDNIKVIEDGFVSLSDRILETGTCLAVVVANHEELKPYEEGYGLDNNIWKDTITTFIPRFLWEDKPVASDARRYSDLYFDYGESSFAITPMGDLIRNYGIPGVFLGMLLLGFILRIIYESLVNDQKFSVWRTTLFYMLLTTVSYEGFYGTILPLVIKFGFVTILGLLAINIFVKKSNRQINMEFER